MGVGHLIGQAGARPDPWTAWAKPTIWTGAPLTATVKEVVTELLASSGSLAEQATVVVPNRTSQVVAVVPGLPPPASIRPARPLA